ncbi:acyl carrier protein [Helicobacter sp. MIT 21-1697]|uniref:acyl carrier protein n=1 Tax=Helicobacter sp. MIT 21-1697 TaxID=2993733 RepID=UPI00224B0EB1|nr:acyl carrier protein [Helicobacter sp. MIT 21-1697]MCX2717897.1 acyl carrier protein [Helicobacter sp. MIT 21-1697]
MEKRIYGILSSVLDMQVDEKTHISMETCEQWSSLAHIDIVMSVEEEFGICFKEGDLASIVSQEALVLKVKEILSRDTKAL